MNEIINYDDIIVPTYIINLPERQDRLVHIKKQFEGRMEFETNIIPACRNNIGALGLWKSILKIINIALKKDDDVIIICEDDHEFTSSYSKEYLIKNIIEAHNQNTNILIGGTTGFGHAVPISENRYWIDCFLCTQFIIVYKSCFEKILREPFNENDTADLKLSEITSKKMVLHPFISIQKEFGYSDISSDTKLLKTGAVTRMFESASDKFLRIRSLCQKYEIDFKD